MPITSSTNSPPSSNIKVTQFVARNDPEILASVVEAIDRREIVVEPAPMFASDPELSTPDEPEPVYAVDPPPGPALPDPAW